MGAFCPIRAQHSLQHRLTCPHVQRSVRHAQRTARRCQKPAHSVAEAPAQTSQLSAEAKVLQGLQAAVSAGKAPSRLLFLFGAFYSNYKGAALTAGVSLYHTVG